MSLHLAEIAAAVAPGAHAVLLLDQAGWHLSKRLVVPPNITLLPLPAIMVSLRGSRCEHYKTRRPRQRPIAADERPWAPQRAINTA